MTRLQAMVAIATASVSLRPTIFIAVVASSLGVAACGSSHSLGAGEYYVAPDGSDAADGSLERPWRTVEEAIDRLEPGDTLFLRGGTYFEELHVDAAGLPDAPITIRSYPGEWAVIDSGPREFRTPGNDDWELVCAGLGEYRATRRHGGDERVYGYIEGIAGYENEQVGLVPYLRDEHFRSTSEDFDDEDFYVGPGLYLEDGHIHIRLAKTAVLRDEVEPRYGQVFASSLPDPREFTIHLSNADYTLHVDGGSYLIFEDMEFRVAKRTIDLTDGAHHITFDGIEAWHGDKTIAISGGHDVLITRSRIYGDVPRWVSWTDAKTEPNPADAWRGEAISLREGAHGVEVSYCHVRGGHDGIGVNHTEYGLEVHYSRIENFADDAFELEGLTDDGDGFVGEIRIHDNYIANSLTLVAPGQDTDDFRGPLYVYRNVLVQLRNHFVNRRPGIVEWNGGERYHFDVMIKNGEARNTHYYQNTMVMLNAVDGINPTPRFPDGSTVANNIMIAVNDQVLDVVRTGAGQVFDGNLYWRMNIAADDDLIAGYSTVDAFHAATGLEEHGVRGGARGHGVDPRFVGPIVEFTATPGDGDWVLAVASETPALASFLLSDGSPAIDAGISLSGRNLPDSRSDGVPDLGALPFGTDAESLEVWPFVPAGGPLAPVVHPAAGDAAGEDVPTFVIFVRGDVDLDREVNITDVIRLLQLLFLGQGSVDCPDAADANDDGAVDLSDAVTMLEHLFLQSPELPPPSPRPGLDPTPDALGLCAGGIGSC